MSGQGFSPINTAYFASMANRANAVTSCADLKRLSVNVTATANGSIAAANKQIAAIQQQVSDLADDIAQLTGHIGTIAATQTATTSLGTVAATSIAVSDLGSAIAYIKAQGAAMVSHAVATEATYVAQVAALGKQLVKIQNDYTRLTNQLSSVQAQITQLPTLLAGFASAVENAATKFPNCSI